MIRGIKYTQKKKTKISQLYSKRLMTVSVNLVVISNRWGLELLNLCIQKLRELLLGRGIEFNLLKSLEAEVDHNAPSMKFHLIQKLHQDLRIIKQHMIEVRVVQQQLQEVDQDQFSQIWKRTKTVFN